MKPLRKSVKTELTQSDYNHLKKQAENLGVSIAKLIRSKLFQNPMKW